MKLFQDKISSAASRVRIALALKDLDVEREAIGILGPDALNRKPEYLQINPQGLVPALLTDEGVLLTQSLAIIEYLDERYPEPPLLPGKLEDRAFARTVALAIAADIHPLLPPRVAAHLGTIGVKAEDIAEWSRHWIRVGLTAVEELLARRQTGQYVAGDAPSMAAWLWHLFAGEIVSQKTLALMWPTPVRQFAYGLDVEGFNELAIGNGGSKTGYGSHFVYLPAHEAVIVSFVNDPDFVVEPMENELLRAVSAH